MKVEGIGDVMKQLREDFDGEFAALAKATNRRLVERSPEDLGVFKANWNLARNRTDESVDADSEDVSGKLAANAAEADRLELGDSCTISNSLPYAGKLEQGHSGQAPRGMVALTEAEILAIYGRK